MGTGGLFRLWGKGVRLPFVLPSLLLKSRYGSLPPSLTLPSLPPSIRPSESPSIHPSLAFFLTLSLPSFLPLPPSPPLLPHPFPPQAWATTCSPSSLPLPSPSSPTERCSSPRTPCLRSSSASPSRTPRGSCRSGNTCEGGVCEECVDACTHVDHAAQGIHVRRDACSAWAGIHVRAGCVKSAWKRAHLWIMPLRRWM